MKDILIPITHTVNIGDYIVYNPETGICRILTDAVKQVAPVAIQQAPEAPAVVEPIVETPDKIDIFSKGPQGSAFRRSQIFILIGGTTEEFTAGQIGRALTRDVALLSGRAWSSFSGVLHHELNVLERAGCIVRIKRPGEQIRFKFIKLPEIPL